MLLTTTTDLARNKPVQLISAHSRAVQGIEFNPFNHNIFATFSDISPIKLWDKRKLVESQSPVSSKNY